ncbi:MAG: hypothetical protein E3J35_02800 [Methanomassiliicoccales archaeon]|nr:MAG: hypothetical protein E3J35_02800 [Methanomassiliicoccales archaeon]
MLAGFPIPTPIEQVNGNCSECTSEHLVRDYLRAKILCEKCGLVLDENLLDRGR